MNLSIVVVSWNSAELLGDCLASVLAECEREGLAQAEAIVVDNASSDGSAALVRDEFPTVVVLENRRNLGFSRASNQGIRRSAGEYVLLLNPDTKVEPGALGETVRFLKSRPEAGAVGPKLLNPDGSLQVSAYPEPTLFREFWRLFHLDWLWPVGAYRMTGWREDAAREVDVLMGAYILLRRKVLDECGLLEEKHFIYSEDQDLCRRIRVAGWRIYWLPSASVVHYGGRSTRQVRDEMFLNLYREKVAYFRTHHGEGAATAYKGVLAAASIARQAISPLALLLNRQRRSRALKLTRLYRRLVRELPGI